MGIDQKGTVVVADEQPVQPDLLICVILDDGLGTIASINRYYCETLGYSEKELRGVPALAILRPHQVDHRADAELWDLHQYAKEHPGVQVPCSTWIPTRRGTDAISVTAVIEYSPSLDGGAWIETVVPQAGPLQLKDAQPARNQQIPSLAVIQRVAETTVEQAMDRFFDRVQANVQASQTVLGTKKKERPSKKFPTDPQEFEGCLSHTLDAIADIPDAQPTVRNVAFYWFPSRLAENTLRTALDFHHLSDTHGNLRDYAGPLKRMFLQRHPLIEVAASLLAGCVCHHLHLLARHVNL